MNETFYKVALAGSFLTFVVIRRLYDVRRRGVGIVRTTHRTRETFLVRMMNVAVPLPTVLWVATDWLQFAAIALPDWIRVGGTLLTMAGMALFAWVHHTVGHNWSPILEVRSDHTLVTAGPYARTRHPMYTAILLVLSGFFLLTANWAVGMAHLLPFLALIAVRIPDEEALMLDRFGHAYRIYMGRTGRLLPKLFSEHSPPA